MREYWLCHPCLRQLRAWLVRCQACRESAFAISISLGLKATLLFVVQLTNLEKVVQILRVSISHPEPCKSNQHRLGTELSTNSPIQLYLSGLRSFEWTAINPEQSIHEPSHTHTIRSTELWTVILYLGLIRGSDFSPECWYSLLQCRLYWSARLETSVVAIHVRYIQDHISTNELCTGLRRFRVRCVTSQH